MKGHNAGPLPLPASLSPSLLLFWEKAAAISAHGKGRGVECWPTACQAHSHVSPAKGILPHQPFRRKCSLTETLMAGS